MDETFLLTNIAPQVGVDFNRHYWAYVEEWCRRLTGSFKDVYVFTVPLYLPKKEADGKWRVVSFSQWYNILSKFILIMIMTRIFFRRMKLLAPRQMLPSRLTSRRLSWRRDLRRLRLQMSMRYRLVHSSYRMQQSQIQHHSKASPFQVSLSSYIFSFYFSSECWTSDTLR